MIRRNLMCLLFLCMALCYAMPAQQTTPPTTPLAPAGADAGSDLIVVKVFGEPVGEKQVLSAINQIAGQKQIPPDPQQPRNVILFQGAIDNIITTTVLKNQVKQLNLAPDKTKVDQQIQMLSKQFPSQEEFQKALASQGMNEAKLRQNIEESLSMQQVIDQAVKNVPPATDDEVQKFYDDNPKAFMMPDQVHAAHILLMVDKLKGTPEQKEETRKIIEEIRADIESNKITFEDAAAKYSQDKSNGPKGGDLGFFARGQMVKPFEDAAFAGKPGTLSPVVETEFGFHIIKVIEQKPAGKVTFEEAKSKVKQYLEAMSRRKAAQQYVSELKAKAPVEKFMTPEEFLKRHPEVK